MKNFILNLKYHFKMFAINIAIMRNYNNIMFECVKTKDFQTLKFLLYSKKVDVNSVNENGANILNVVCSFNYTKVAAMILSIKPEVHIYNIDKNFQSAIIHAYKNKNKKLVKMLAYHDNFNQKGLNSF